MNENENNDVLIGPAKDYLTMREIADELRVSKEQVRQWCVSGELRSADYGTGSKRQRRVRREWLEAFKRGRESLRERSVSQTRRPQPSAWKWQGTKGIVASAQGSLPRAIAQR